MRPACPPARTGTCGRRQAARAALAAALAGLRRPRARPSANSSTILALKAGRSSGLRLVTRPSSTWTSSSTQVAAGVADVGLQRRPRGDRAALDDVGLDEHPRRVADRRRPACPASKKRGRSATASVVGAQEVGVGDAAGQQQPVVVVGVGVGDRLVDRERVALVEVVEGLDLARLERQQLDRRARRPRRALRGSVSSTCSTPSVARGSRSSCRPACRHVGAPSSLVASAPVGQAPGALAYATT